MGAALDAGDVLAAASGELSEYTGGGKTRRVWATFGRAMNNPYQDAEESRRLVEKLQVRF